MLRSVDLDSRLYLALELKGGSSHGNGIISAWNVQQDKLNKLNKKYQKEKFKTHQYEKVIREQSAEMTKLEIWKKQEEERKIKVAFYATELAKIVNSTKYT
jgi:putative protein kinase ArgK-like GTPase of G3E family